MIGKFYAQLLLSAISTIKSQANSEEFKIGEILKKIASHPIKVIASFITAPFLIIRVALQVKNKTRRILAIAGLLISILVSYICATFLGTFIGSLFVMSHIGFISGIGLLIGLTSSIYLSVLFSIISFNAVSFLFLKISTQEVAEYLEEISK